MKGRRVAIVGIGSTPRPGENHVRKTFKEMIVEAAYEAISDANNLDPKEIQAGAYAYHGEVISEYGGIGPTVSDTLGISPAPVFVTCSNCTGSAVALQIAQGLVSSGRYDIMIAGGFEKQSDHFNYGEIINLSTEADWDFMLGFTHADAFELATKSYLQRYGYSEEIIARWAYEMHWYGRKYSKATLYGTPLPTMDELMKQPGNGGWMVWGEGSCAVILAAEEIAHKYTDKPVFIDGMAYTCISHYFGHRYNYPGFPCPELKVDTDLAVPANTLACSEQAYKMAGIKPKDIDVVQVYDGCLISGHIQLEGLKICGIGEAGRFVLNGEMSLNGACPTNTDGGNIARGHASGADGLNQIVELVTQLRGNAGERQVKNAKIGVANDVGGYAAHNTTIVLRND